MTCLFWFVCLLYSPDCPGICSVDQTGLKLRDPPASAPLSAGFKGLYYDQFLTWFFFLSQWRRERKLWNVNYFYLFRGRVPAPLPVRLAAQNLVCRTDWRLHRDAYLRFERTWIKVSTTHDEIFTYCYCCLFFFETLYLTSSSWLPSSSLPFANITSSSCIPQLRCNLLFETHAQADLGLLWSRLDFCLPLPQSGVKGLWNTAQYWNTLTHLNYCDM